MKKTHVLANAILWAAAIIASAALGSPHFLSLILLPSLAILALLAASSDTCFKRSELS